MSPLFPFDTAASSPKINVTTGRLPPYVSAAQAPTKKAPWKTIRDVGFIHSTTVALPEELYHLIWRSVEDAEAVRKLRYAKVVMKLEGVLNGEFFAEYIKRGNILMLSEGQPGVDSVFSLQDGVLRLELAKEIYERTGLQGTPVRSGGRKHVKSRYLVEYNLRLPSMLHGKKGFERLVWAAKTVLNNSLQWLFFDLNDDHAADLKGPITAHHPTIIHSLTPSIKTLSNVLVPSTLATNAFTHATLGRPTSSQPSTSSVPEDLQESILDLFEYVDLLSLASPRVQIKDHVDPFISRYQVPDLPDPDQKGHTRISKEEINGQTVKVLTWTGLIPVQWVLELLCTIVKQSRKNQLPDQAQQWLALTVSAHKIQAVGQVDGYTIILQSDSEPDDPESRKDPALDEDNGHSKNRAALGTVNNSPEKRSAVDDTGSSAKRFRLDEDTSIPGDSIDRTKPANIPDEQANADVSGLRAPVAPGDADVSMTEPTGSETAQTRTAEARTSSEEETDSQTRSVSPMQTDVSGASRTEASGTTAKIAAAAAAAAAGAPPASRSGFQRFICAEYVDSLV